jgi:membrane protease YdiL (CAAX protease family)
MAPAGILMGFGVGIVMTIVVGLIAQAAGSSLSHPSPAVSLVENLVFDLSFVAAAIYFGASTGRLRAADFGFRRIRLGLGVKAFLLAGLAYYVLTAVYATVFALHGSDKLPSELGVHRSTAALIGAAVFVCVVAPICEETFFRGFVFGALSRVPMRIGGRNGSVAFAAIVTGILFGLAHTGSANPEYLVPLGFLGLILCLVRYRTGSLYPCMALHSFNNALALGLNELHWNGLEILGLAVAALAVIGALTGPLTARRLHVGA